MASLADPSAAPGSLALPMGHPFTQVETTRYWKATRTIDSTAGYLVDLGAGGNVVIEPLTAQAFFWCVRGGGPISEY
jgi:hypothetical protein